MIGAGKISGFKVEASESSLVSKYIVQLSLRNVGAALYSSEKESNSVLGKKQCSLVSERRESSSI